MPATTLTLFRLALLPFILWSFLQGNVRLAIVFFIAILLSTIFAAFFTRNRKRTSRIGSFLEPLTDKIIVYSILLAFLLRGEFWALPFLIFISREVLVNVFRFVATKNDIVLKKDHFGRMFLLYLLVLFLLGAAASPEKYLAFFLQQGIAVVTGIAALFAFLSITITGISLFHELQKVRRRGRLLPPQKVVILANKKSRGYHDAYRRRLLRIFARRRKAKLFFIAPGKRGLFQSSERKTKGAHQIIIAGGDGTFESALNYPLFQQKSLGFFPLGAGNAFYSYFYRGKRFAYLRSRFPFREEELDVLEAVWERGKRETLFLSVGIDAEVIRFAKERTQQGVLDYLGASWRAIRQGKASYDLSCTVDNQTFQWGNAVSVTLAKIPYYGYGARSLIGKIPPHDGQVYGLACVNTHPPLSNKPIRIWGLVLTALGEEKPPLRAFKGKEITIKSRKPFPIQAGGEFLGMSRFLTVRVKRKQKVLVI